MHYTRDKTKSSDKKSIDKFGSTCNLLGKKLSYLDATWVHSLNQMNPEKSGD